MWDCRARSIYTNKGWDAGTGVNCIHGQFGILHVQYCTNELAVIDVKSLPQQSLELQLSSKKSYSYLIGCRNICHLTHLASWLWLVVLLWTFFTSV